MPTDGVFTRIWRPHLWGSGPDGWPLLAITIGGKEPGSLESSLPSSKLPAPVVHLLELLTGRELDPITGFSRPQTGDLDGDGIADLWGEWNGQLCAFRGETPESCACLTGSARPRTSMPTASPTCWLPARRLLAALPPKPPAAGPRSLARVATGIFSGKSMLTGVTTAPSPTADSHTRSKRFRFRPAISMATAPLTCSP